MSLVSVCACKSICESLCACALAGLWEKEIIKRGKVCHFPGRDQGHQVHRLKPDSST